MLLPVCGLVCGNKSLCSPIIRGKPHNCEGGEMIYRISIHFLTIRRKTCAHRKMHKVFTLQDNHYSYRCCFVFCHDAGLGGPCYQPPWERCRNCYRLRKHNRYLRQKQIAIGVNSKTISDGSAPMIVPLLLAQGLIPITNWDDALLPFLLENSMQITLGELQSVLIPMRLQQEPALASVTT